MLKAVIFDFDGVIADSERLHFRAANEVFAWLGVDLAWEKYYADYLAYTDQECFQAVARDYGVSMTENELSALIAKKTEIFERLARQESTLIDGVAGFIDMLKANNIRLAICSGACLNDIEVMLDGSELLKEFEVVVTADDTTRGKPDPQGYLLTLDQLNSKVALTAEECVVVEDSFGGIKAAKAAGMRCLAVANTYPLQELAEYADRVVKELGQVSIEELGFL